MSKIEWTDITWNPVTGCSKISPGCDNCYAERMAKRLAGRFGYPEDNPFKPTLHESQIDMPSKLRKPRKIFVCSMGDLFHEDVQAEWIAKVILTAASNPKSTFIFLTKRPENMKAFFDQCGPWEGWISHNGKRITAYGGKGLVVGDEKHWPPKNIWLGVTAENQEQADKRIPILLKIPAAIRFVSVEPMLETIDITRFINRKQLWKEDASRYAEIAHQYPDCEIPNLDWVICGGETGPAARPMHTAWVRSLRDQCTSNDTPFFFKQWGEWAPSWPASSQKIKPRPGLKFFGQVGEIPPVYKIGKKLAGRVIDGKTWSQSPGGTE